MSGRLRSPPTQKIAFLCLVVKVSSVVHMLSVYSIDDLGGLYSAPTISCFPFSSVIEVCTYMCPFMSLGHCLHFGSRNALQNFPFYAYYLFCVSIFISLLSFVYI